MASTTIPGWTSKGMLWMVSPSMQSASATFSSSSRPHAFEPYVFQGDRETDFQAEVHDLLDRTLLEHEHVHLGLLPAPWCATLHPTGVHVAKKRKGRNITPQPVALLLPSPSVSSSRPL
jgi:hypothetical protein